MIFYAFIFCLQRKMHSFSSSALTHVFNAMNKLCSSVTWCKFEGQGRGRGGAKEVYCCSWEVLNCDSLFIGEACSLISFLLVKLYITLFSNRYQKGGQFRLRSQIRREVNILFIIALIALSQMATAKIVCFCAGHCSLRYLFPTVMWGRWRDEVQTTSVTSAQNTEAQAQ